jgi:predicted HAD superfamily hydrolase
MWQLAVIAKSILSLIQALLPSLLCLKLMSCTEYHQHLFERNILPYSFKMDTLLYQVLEQFTYYNSEYLYRQTDCRVSSIIGCYAATMLSAPSQSV